MDTLWQPWAGRGIPQLLLSLSLPDSCSGSSCWQHRVAPRAGNGLCWPPSQGPGPPLPSNPGSSYTSTSATPPRELPTTSSMWGTPMGSLGAAGWGRAVSCGVRRLAVALISNVLFLARPLQPPTVFRGQHPLPPAGPHPRGAEACVLLGTHTPGHPRGLPLGQ